MIDFKNEHIYKNKKYVYINNHSEHLIIVLNTHNQGDRYFGYKTLSEGETDVDLLFLVDAHNKYYLDHDKGKTYLELIELIIKNYDLEKVTIFGASMAGFAALHFSMELKLNVIAINPQINLSSAEKLAWPKLRETLSNLDSHYDLENGIIQKYSGQSIFLTFGQHRLDKQAYQEFIGLNLPNVSVIIRLIDSIEHKFFLNDLLHIKDIHFLGIENRRLSHFIKP